MERGKENGHVQACAPIGAMVLKWRGSLTSKLDGLPIASEPHFWRQACPWRKSLSRKIALTRIKFYGRKLQVKAFQTSFGQMQGCADFMRLWRNFMPRQFSSWTGFTRREWGSTFGIAVELARKAIPGWASELLWSVSLSMIFHYLYVAIQITG